jgi:mRNA interferase YafQ
MRTIDRSKAFKRDFKKHGAIETSLIEVLYKLLNDESLPSKYRDHALTGDWEGFRECHVKPDLLLIYQQNEKMELVLARLGSHSELF